MIIGINGRIGAGKDTVGNIIQYIITNSRSDINPISYSTWLKLKYSRYDIVSGWYIKKFAFKLKQIASILTGIEVDKFESQDFKKTNLGPEWGGMQVRTFLQRLGTDCVRDNLHKNTWLNAMYCDYKEGDNWIITDMRFPNEFDSVKERGGITIRIRRNLPEAGYATLEQLHPSETALDDHKFDYEFDNNGTIEELIEKVKLFLQSEKII